MIHIRPFEPYDWDRLCAIHDTARLDELRSSGLEAAFLSLAQTAESEGLFAGTLLVAEREGRVEGFVAFTERELTWLYVHPQAGRQGIGRALLREAIRLCSSSPLSAEVLVGNDGALALYQSEGFHVLRRVDGRLTGNETFAASGYVLQKTPSPEAHIDFAGVSTEREVHELFARSLSFPNFYGHNWDAFWDVLTGFDRFPRRLLLSSTQHLRTTVPRAYKQLQSCFAQYQRDYPDIAPEVIWS